MKASGAICIDDLRMAARRRLPGIIFDYIEGGAEDELCIDRNISALRDIQLWPRYMRDVTVTDQSAELFGERFSRPFGVAPMGMAAMAHPDADLHLAAAAAVANAPFILSGASNASIEKVAAVHPGAWYQLYLPANADIRRDLIRRVRDAGLSTLVVTVDVPAHSKRERSIRAGWVRPYRPTLGACLEALLHPRWVIDYLRRGLPYLENWQSYAAAGASAMEVANTYAHEVPAVQTWDTLKQVRQEWPGRLVLKGIMHPEDASLAVACGADGIIVSNHGGRQFDRSPASIEVLRRIRKAAGEATTLMFDGGVTRGTDVLAAFCLGARMVFVGRAALYGVGAFGRPGVDRAFAILSKEVDIALAQLGAGSIRNLDETYLFRESAHRA